MTMTETPQLAGGAPATEAVALDVFQSLLAKEFCPRDEEEAERISSAVRTLAEQALQHTRLVSDDAIRTIRALIARLDRQLTEQVSLVLHHPDFQQLEGAWRGLHHLVNNTETDEMLKIRFMNISKKDLGKTLETFEGNRWDESPIFRKLYNEEYDFLGGQPYGCLIGDYYFDHSPGDIRLLGNMAKICAAAHTPFISGASPTLFGMEGWQELMNLRDLERIVSTPGYAEWNLLRTAEDSRYIGLAMPRVLARLPHGAKTVPVEAFDFEEDVTGQDHHKYCWMNAAYAMAVNINRSFKLYGWCARIRGVESGGVVENLPTHTSPTDHGGVDMKCPTEIAIGERREVELSKNGLMALMHLKNSGLAVFISAQSLQKPQEYDDPDATANAKLATRLPYLFAVCRFAHYLKAIARDKIGSFEGREDMQKFLQQWITNYVDATPNTSTEAVMAQRPLRAAVVRLEPHGNGQFYLRPHYQLEGLTATLRLVSRLPARPGW